MKVLSTGKLSPERELKVKCHNCDSELLGKLSEFKEASYSEVSDRLEAKYQVNCDWWCHDLDMNSISEDIPNIEAIRDDEENLGKLKNDIFGLLVETKFKSGLVMFPNSESKPVKLHAKCPVCGEIINTSMVTYSNLNITSPYDDCEKPFMIRLQKEYGEYIQEIDVVPTNQRVIQYLLKCGYEEIAHEMWF